jgi:hypothetical protein
LDKDLDLIWELREWIPNPQAGQAGSKETISTFATWSTSDSIAEAEKAQKQSDSQGVEDPGTFTVALISGVRVLFTPSTAFRKAIESIKFEKGE